MSAIFASDQVASAVFDGDGATRIFPFSFRIFSPDDVRVLVDGVAITTGFHVGMATTSSASTGGVVTFAIAPAEGQHIRVERRLGLRRLSTYDSGSSLRADALNADFDFMVAALGDVQNAVGQSLRLPDIARDVGVSAQLPAIDPGRAMVWPMGRMPTKSPRRPAMGRRRPMPPPVPRWQAIGPKPPLPGLLRNPPRR